MKVEEAMKLKPGDLVMIRWKKAATIYKNLVYEVVNTRSEGRWKAWVEVKQPGFDMGFRDTISASLLKRYEDVIKEDCELVRSVKEATDEELQEILKGDKDEQKPNS